MSHIVQIKTQLRDPIANPPPPSQVGRLRLGDPPSFTFPGVKWFHCHQPGMPATPIDE